jgi:flagellar hook-associated protein 1
MSLTGSLNSALSGLNAAARAAELISSNVANAMTEGYARRELQTSARVVGQSGQGVKVDGVLRQADLAVIADRRVAQAGSSASSTVVDFMTRLETALGSVGSEGSLVSRVAGFSTSLQEAASRPDADTRLIGVLQSATALTQQISSAATAIQSARADADGQISDQVSLLNITLNQVAQFNGDIGVGLVNGRDVSALMDQRQRAIDSIASIVPLREVPRSYGGVALFTTGGAIILDGKPAEFGFTAAGVVVAGMTQASGALSGLTLDDRSVATSGDGSLISGGTLAAAFQVRDSLAPAAQANLDALARDLITRFADPATDPSLPLSAPGLFTDTGSGFDPSAEVGLAQRLSVNSSVDPTKGGDLSKLRDGLGAMTPGPVGSAAQFNRFSAALESLRTPASGGFSAASRSFATLATDMTSFAASGRVAAENDATYNAAKLETVKTLELQGGVDTDHEMQTLLLIEKAYTANAKVISVVNDLLQRLLEI